MKSLVSGALAFLAAIAAGAIVLRIIRDRIVDVPTERSSHTKPTPRGGGISIVAGVMAGMIAMGALHGRTVASLLLALLLGAVGLLDDIKGMRVFMRLGVQTALSGLTLLWLLEDMTEPLWGVIGVSAIALVWLVGYTNAFNFMDGINGIGAAQLIVAGATWVAAGIVTGSSLMTGLGTVTCGAALGFLPWNFPKARFFMGDVGSYFSGAWLASITVVGIRTGVHPVVMLAPLSVFAVDTSITLFRRIVKGDTWYRPHKTHVYQRLVVGGWSHAATTGLYTLLATATAASGLAWLSTSPWLRAAAAIVGSAALALYVAAPAVLQRTNEDPT